MPGDFLGVRPLNRVEEIDEDDDTDYSADTGSASCGR